MREMVIVGAAETRFGKSESSYRELAVEAGRKAMEDAGVDPGRVESLVLGSFSPGTFVNQEHVAPLVASELGLDHVPSTRTENACASGATAVMSGLMQIGAGMQDVVLVVGVEKMTSTPIGEATSILAEAADWESEASAGLTFPGVYALMARAYMHQFGKDRSILDAVAIKAHANGVDNPYAQFRKPITADDIRESLMIADPLTLYDCSPISDGAAAVVLASKDVAGEFQRSGIPFLGVGQSSDALALHERQEITSLPSAKRAGERAFRMAGISPSDVSIAEVHDCFTIAEIMATEDLGFFEPGTGGDAAISGRTGRDGTIPINASGGLKAKGHPVGASGVGQIVESVFQLRGEAEGRQVDGVEYALTHNVGGSGATCVVTILGKGE